jgi:hypothetical protein
MTRHGRTPGNEGRTGGARQAFAGLALTCLLALLPSAAGANAASGVTDTVPLWMRGPGAVGFAEGVPLWLRASALPGASSGARAALDASPPRDIARRNARALWPALLSGLVPGAGQLRNGSLLRGLGYFAVEIGGWIAYDAFRDGSRERLGEVARLAAYWDHTRYQEVATNSDSCALYGCTYGLWSAEADSEIVQLSQSDRNRYYEYLARDAYACGWDSTLSRSLYRETWDDRETMLDAKRWMGRVIFLNHLVSAVDAFVGARTRHIDLGQGTHLEMDVRGLPPRMAATVRVTREFGGWSPQ